MPLIIVYPVKPEVLKQILEVLGEPRNLEVEISIKNKKVEKLLKQGKVERFTVRYSCKPKAKSVLKLYREYYEGYVKATEKTQVKEALRTILSFKAEWYTNGFSAVFNGFKLRINVYGNVNKAIKLLRIFKKKPINIEVDLSSRKA